MGEKKYITEFLIFYKFFLFILFLDKENKLYNLFITFRFQLYFNYVLYSIFYFSKLYIINKQNLELNKKIKITTCEIPIVLNSKLSYLFYSKVIFKKTNNFFKDIISISKEDVPLSLFGLNRINYKTLKDGEFSKIIYQRRGRIFIPLTSFIYSQDIRNSLGLKLILNENKNISGLFKNSYKNRFLVNLLDFLILKNKDDFIYQSDKDANLRKEAYS